jgi:hypothetical protein
VRSRFVAGFTLVTLLAAAATSIIQQAQPYKYENYRAAETLVDTTARPGDAMLFLPASTRVGYLQYAGHAAGDPQVLDVALRRGGEPSAADQISGYEVAPTVLTDRLRSHPRVFLIGAPLSAAGTMGGSTDQVKELALRSGYALVWSRAFGVVSVSLFVRPPASAAVPATDQTAPSGGVRAAAAVGSDVVPGE